MKLRPQKIRKFLPLPKKGGRRRLPVWVSAWFTTSAGQQRKAKLKRVARFGKAPCISTSLQVPHPRKGSSRSSRNLIVYRWYLVPPNGLSITHHHPMRNAVRAEIAGMSSSRHQRDSYPILTVQVYTELYLNRKAKLSTGWGDWCACPKWWPYHLLIAFNLQEMDIIITTFSSSCLPFPPGDMVIYVAKGQAMAWR